MEIIGERTRGKIVRAIYLVAFLTAVHYAFVIYINSSYLGTFVSNRNLGFLYVLAAIATIFAIPKLSRILKMVGQFVTVTTILFLDFLAISTLAITSSPIFSETSTFRIGDSVALIQNNSTLLPWIPAVIIVAFLLFQILIVLNRILMDIYLEEFSKYNETGGTRGWFLTSMNLAFVLSPFIVGAIVTGENDGFWKIYSISAIFLLLAILVVWKKLRHVKDVIYHSPPFFQTIKKIARNKNIGNIYLSSLLLEFFYSWMVIYTPIYLHKEIGLEWNQIGIIFSIMLTAFIIFELPLGKIADKYLGEKEILTTGFVIIAITTGLLTFIKGSSVVIWSLALFGTRIGASFIEIMNETYFFKKVLATDTDIIGFFRNTGPTGYIMGPALASVILYFVDYKYLFLILGIIMLFGIKFSLSIKDTL